MYQRVRALAAAFLEWGVKKGDRIGLIGENRWEMGGDRLCRSGHRGHRCAHYPPDREQVAVLIKDAGCKVAVVSTRQQYDKLNAVRGQTDLERIAIMDSAAAPEGRLRSAH